MKILIAGSRNYTNRKKIHKVISALSQDTVVVHGDCRGADKIAASVATKLQLTVECYPADWKQYGKAAGPIRNQQMLDDNNIEKAIIFHECLEESKGTKDMLSRLKKKGISVDIYS
uniref:DNA recombination-mediator protein A n=1 Tax=Marseillevirus LCMAC201 TaxID=2506605 RepID=A0A481YWI5_9VIRU|nr:MAG: DNA recombination-mediator protein A [Marseillevirus LCMAC201]